MRFFRQFKKNMWTEAETRHTLVYDDVERELQAPDIKMSGSRICYIFAGMNKYLPKLQ